MKKIFKFLGLLFLGLLIAMLILPFVYESEIIEELKQEVNKEIDGSIDFTDIGISFFKSFPNVAVSLTDFSLTSHKTDKYQDLLSAEELTIDLDLMTFLKRSEKQIVNNIKVSDAVIKIYTDKNGKSNYDLSKSNAPSESAYLVALNEYGINNSTLLYIDDQNQTEIKLTGVDHNGSGNFTEQIYDLNHITTIENANLEIANISYLSNLPIKSNMVTKIDQTKSLYEIDTKSLTISNLQLDADGQVKMNENSFDIDLDITGVNEKLEDLISIIPGVFKSNIEDLAVNGYGSFQGSINGAYSSANNVKPAIAFELKSKDGTIRSKSTNDQIKDLNTEVKITAQKSDWSDLMIQVPSFSSTIDDQVVSGKFITQDLMTDPLFDATLKGMIDLSKIQNVLSFESINSMQGNLDVDLELYGKKSDIINENYEALKFDNTSKSEQIVIDFKTLPTLNLDKLDLNANKKTLQINNLNGKMGNSDFRVSGEIENPLILLTADGIAKGDLTMNADLLDLNEFTQKDTDKTDLVNVDIPKDKVDLTFDLNVEDLKYEDYDIKQLNAKGSTLTNSLNLQSLTTQINGSKLDAVGEFNNTYAYVMNNDTLFGKMVVNSPKFDVDKFLGDSKGTENAEPTRIPQTMTLLLDLNADAVKYEKYDLRKFKTEVLLSEGRAIFSDMNANTFDGNINMDGMYDTSTKDPKLSFSYDIKNFSFKSFYEGSELFQKLAPIAEYIDGHFNSNMSMNATLQDGFDVDLSTITADGFLETIHGSLNDFLPVEEMAKKMGVSNLSKIAIDKSKNWFTVKNGAVILEDHDYDYEGIKMTIGGSHKLNQTIDYLAKVEIPRALFENSNGAVDLIDSGLDRLSKEATGLGIDIFNGDYIYADVNITGSILSPKIKIRPTGSGGESLTEQAKESIKEKGREIKDEYVKKGQAKADAVKDTLTDIVTTKIDTLESKAEEVIKEKTDEVIDKATDVITSQVDSTISKVIKDTLATEIAKQVEDILKDKTKETDKIKDKLKDFKIFKKKGN